MRRTITLLSVFLLALATEVFAQQPFSGCWHLDFVKSWSAANDPDARFNRSVIPLQPRFRDLTTAANPNQRDDAKITAAFIMSPMCSKTPSQGANDFLGFSPTYWQYLDMIVWSGGSAGEGIIIPPSAPVVDAAHRNGVKVLGQVFLTVTEFGGQPAWVKELVKVENGEYVYARKLYEIAKYYGFDGWAINKKTPSDDTPAEWAGFVAEFYKQAQQDNNTSMQIQFYDAGKDVTPYMEVVSHPGASYFMEFGNATAPVIAAQMGLLQSAGYDKAAALEKMYFGIECAQGGIGGNGNYFKALFEKTKHNGSAALFNPEEGIWKIEVEALLGTPDVVGEKAYAAMKKIVTNEGRFFTNVQQDPTVPAGWNSSSWPGLANAIAERSVIQTKPFITNFSAGQGKKRFVNGEQKAVQDWYHRGMQDIMPTWRWWIEAPKTGSAKNIAVSIDWDDAYNQGTSLLVSGKLTANQDQRVRLYKTKLPIAAGDKLQLVYKASAGSVVADLGVSENSNAFTSFTLTPSTTSNGWMVAEVDLSSLAGKTVSVIALNFKSGSDVADFSARLGQLAIYPSGYAPGALQVNNLTIQNALKQTGGDIRLLWDAPLSSDISHYNIYFTQGGVKKLVGQTRSEAFYIPKFTRTGMSELSVSASVSVVTKNMVEGSENQVTASYPEITLPVVSVKALKTLLKPGEEVVIKARADNLPTAYRWTLPQQATLVSQAADSVVVKFGANGLYDITVAVDNQKGTTTETATQLIQVSDTKSINLVSVGKTIHSVSNFLEPERPQWLLDGVGVPGNVREKWCIGGKKEHWVVVDLHEVYELYRFRIFDCGNKESAADNFRMYKIYVSNDLANWTLVVDETNRLESLKDDYIKPTKGRYVKLIPYDDELPITIRLWEFEAYGAAGKLQVTTPTVTQDISLGQTLSVSASFSLGGEAKAPDFAVKVTSENPGVIGVNNINVDDNTGNITFDITALAVGKTNVAVEVTNGGWNKQASFEVKVADASMSNIALNKQITATTGADKDPDDNAGEATTINDGNHNSYWNSSWSSADDHQVVVDLGEPAQINNVRLLFKEQKDFYVRPANFNISVGTTPDAMQPVITRADAQVEWNNEIVLPEPVNGRYVQVDLKVANDFAFAIAEFEVYGKYLSSLRSDEAIRLSITPNPVNRGELLRVSLQDMIKAEFLSLQGVLMETVVADGGHAQFEIGSFTPGVYVVRVTTPTRVSVSKVIVR